MRSMKYIVALSLVLAVTVPAGAISFNQPYAGPVVVKLASYDMGVIYAPPAAAQVGIPAVNAYEAGGGGFVYPAAPGGTYYDTFGVASTSAGYDAAMREDGWGIFRITDIRKPDNTILWQDGFAGQELVGMFYGLVDNDVVANTFGTGTVQQSQGVRFDIYSQAFDTFATAGGPGLGSSGRTGFSTYVGLTGGALELACLSAHGDMPGPVSNEFYSETTPNAGFTTGQGSFHARLDIIGGFSMLQFNTNGGGGGTDFSLDGTTHSNPDSTGIPVGDWTVTDQDPLRGNAIPEPFTMLGVFMGIGGIGGYIRRRMA